MTRESGGFRVRALEVGGRPTEDGPLLIEGRRFTDERGWFTESWKASTFRALGIGDAWSQDSLAWSGASVIRGLHYQLRPAAQAKLVRALVGRILDVAVDLRRDSATFGGATVVELDAGGGAALYVPEGFAHGYQVLGNSALVAYKAGGEYAPEFERSLRWDDASLAIPWQRGDAPPLLSEKDRRAPTLEELTAEDLF